MNEKLPRGIRIDRSRSTTKIYRVRRYRNGKAYRAEANTLAEAKAALQKISEKLKLIPVLTRVEMRRGTVPNASFGAMARAMRS